MHYGRLAIGALLAAAACNSAAAAPAGAPPEPGRQFDVTFLGTVEHDTDLPKTSADEAAKRKLSLDDTTYLPTLNIDARLPVGRQAVFFNGVAGYTFHENNSILDSERLNLLGGTDLRISSCQSRLSGGYQRSLLDIQDVVLTNTITDKLQVKRIGIDAKCGRRTGFGLTFSASQDWGDHSSTFLTVQDYRSTSYSAGVSYTRPVLGTISAYGSYAKIEYPHRQTLFGQTDGIENTTGAVTFDHRLGSRIEGTVTVGYTEVTQLAVNPFFPSKDFRGVTYSVAAKYRVSRRLTTDLLFERAIRPSNRLGSNYDLLTHYRLNGEYGVGKRITLNLGAERQDINSSATGILAVNTLTNSRTDTVHGGARYEFSRRLSLILDGGQEWRKANLALFDYRDTRVSLAAHFRY